jgi:hypothetical protein
MTAIKRVVFQAVLQYLPLQKMYYYYYYYYYGKLDQRTNSVVWVR